MRYTAEGALENTGTCPANRPALSKVPNYLVIQSVPSVVAGAIQGRRRQSTNQPASLLLTPPPVLLYYCTLNRGDPPPSPSSLSTHLAGRGRSPPRRPACPKPPPGPSTACSPRRGSPSTACTTDRTPRRRPHPAAPAPRTRSPRGKERCCCFPAPPKQKNGGKKTIRGE